MNEQEIKTYINEQRALKPKPASYEAIAQALNDQGVPTPTGKGKWSKSAVHGIANAGKPTRAEIMDQVFGARLSPEREAQVQRADEVIDATKPRDRVEETKEAAHYAEATRENKDEWITVFDGDFDSGYPARYRPRSASFRRWREDTHKWDEELAAFVKLTTEEKLEKFQWHEPLAWDSFEEKDRLFGVGRDQGGVGSITPSPLVKLLSKRLEEDFEALLDRHFKGELIGTGRVDKGQLRKAVRWLVQEVELQRQANLALRWEIAKLKQRQGEGA